MSTLRRAIAMTATALVLAGGTTLTTTSVASARSWCGGQVLATQNLQYGYHVTPCVYSNHNVDFRWTGGTTDVRAFTALGDPCDPRDGVDTPEPGRHVNPGTTDMWMNFNPCGGQLNLYSYLKESGTSHPGAYWSYRF
ncbi:hypothetical protein [Streptomyces sp. CBMA152]|uniref:hypothetical protein n=1 Tax=Streptomyces sp. CBMA152 TaxID=1896312 RepID=UPI0016612F68|nr:hypothetical protein [Streptomyces sp. CBMA152]MBD0742345.1 hypothetical protein [Streptomyces sp. CBMA152]